MKITRHYLQEIFAYADGNLLWKKKPNRRIVIGEVAGSVHDLTGRKHMRLDGKTRLLHRLIWCWHHDEMPVSIDHIDGDPGNNRIENLRSASLAENQRNRKVSTKSKSGIKGVHKARRASEDRWIAQIKIDGKGLYLGSFDSPEKASAAYDKAAKSYFGAFARLNGGGDAHI